MTMSQKRSVEHFTIALLLARNPTERRFFRQRLGACAESSAERAHEVYP